MAADHRAADIFALGVVLYEMLAGRRAFSGTVVPAGGSAAPVTAILNWAAGVRH